VERGIIEAVGLVGVLLIAGDGISSNDRLVALLGRIVIGTSAISGLAIIEFFSGIDFTKYIAIPGLISGPVITDLTVRVGEQARLQQRQVRGTCCGVGHGAATGNTPRTVREKEIPGGFAGYRWA